MPSPHLPSLNDETLDRDFLAKGGVSLLEFTAPWCPPCRALEPVLADLAQRLAGKVGFAQVDVDEHPTVGERFGIRSMPTMLLFRDGQVVDQLVGAAPRATIEARIRRALG